MSEYCENCRFYTKKYDEFQQDFDDCIVIGDNVVHHFCPMYLDHIPDGIFYKGEHCEYKLNK